jgi:dihydrofolate synthase/folylpolyglutamate synthase
MPSSRRSRDWSSARHGADPDEPNAFDAEALAEIAKAEGFDVVPTASVPDALTRSQAALNGPGRVLICGSLYLAGHVLKLHG